MEAFRPGPATGWLAKETVSPAAMTATPMARRPLFPLVEGVALLRGLDKSQKVGIDIDRDGVTCSGDGRFELHDLLRSSSRERRTLEVRQSESAAIVHVDREQSDTRAHLVANSDVKALGLQQRRNLRPTRVVRKCAMYQHDILRRSRRTAWRYRCTSAGVRSDH